MDPHSRLSQFNHRYPKHGPQPSRHLDTMSPSRPSLDAFSNRPKYSTDAKSSAASTANIRRPISTNSRVKHDGKLRKDMYLAFINNALHQKAHGAPEPFDELVQQFSLKRPGVEGSVFPAFAQVRSWLSALSHVVSRLERTHVALIEAIVNIPWTMLDAATVRAYTIFIGMLISARPEYLALVLEKIAQGFTHQSSLQTLMTALPESSSQPLTRRLIYDRFHSLLRHLISVIPTLPSPLRPFLICYFPHKRQSIAAQSTYIRNLLRVSGYCPELAYPILATIVDRAIQIDVEIQVELDELEEIEDAEVQAVFELDPFDIVVGQEGSDQDSSNESDQEDSNFSDLSSDAEDMPDDGRRISEVPRSVVHIQEMVKKLDVILTLVFKHFARNNDNVAVEERNSTSPDISPFEVILTPLPSLDDAYFTPQVMPSFEPLQTKATSPKSQSPTPPVPNTENLKSNTGTQNQFNILLKVFDRIILRTFKSRYTQFLLFYYTSLDPEFADIFQGMLVELALFSEDERQTDPRSANISPSNSSINTSRNSAMMRAAAASYIGSFVSRATFVDRAGTRRMVGILCEYLCAHLDGVEEALRAGTDVSNGTQHSVFYAVAQAVFLIFCFRWRDLRDDEEEEVLGRKKWMAELGVLQRVVTCVLNPLRVCSTNVVVQFARVAHATDFVYCYGMLEANKRSENGHGQAPEGHSIVGRTGVVHSILLGEPLTAELNTFFPFDPYRLPKSNAFIQDVYREWSSVAINDEDDEDDGEDDEGGEDDEDDGEDGDDDIVEGEDEDDDDEEKDAGSQTLLTSGNMSIPKAKVDDPSGLGKSLDAMSISPVHVQPQSFVVMRDSKGNASGFC